jgi:tetratricopeptide (TPR) repeat protein
MEDHEHTHAVPYAIRKLMDTALGAIDQRELDSAARTCERVAAALPSHPDVRHTLGLIYLEQGRVQLALRHIGRSIELNPRNARAYRSMGDALSRSGQYPLAVRAYERSCILDPDNPDAMLNKGNALHAMNCFDEAGQAYLKILDRMPDHSRALNNLAKLHQDLRDHDRALALYNRCIDRHPEYAEARFNRALLLLSIGAYKQGWKAYEWRFKRAEASRVYPHRLATPRWKGEPFGGRHLLIHCEQGMGDVLQFCRYLPMVKALGGEVTLEVHRPLVRLFHSHSCIDRVIAFDRRRPATIPHDLHVPLMSLPMIFDTSAHTIPSTVPYLHIDGPTSARTTAHIRKDRFNVGLFWSSSDLDPRRNLPIGQCSRWFDNPGIHFVSLQVGEASGQLQAMRNRASSITELGHAFEDFHDTAQALAGLDLVVSVDTAVAHLAGAMGKALWVLLPFSADWRWEAVDGVCPWYPRARLFRQPRHGDWQPVIREVGRGLGRQSG